MNIKTRLENDTVLYSYLDHKSRITTFRHINALGVYTIEDFLNMDISDFPGASMKTYFAVQQVFKCAYLGEDLVYDETIRKKYTVDYAGYLEASKDLSLIGITGYAPNKINIMLKEDGFDKKTVDSVSMETILKAAINFKEKRGIKGCLANFYINRIHGKKKNSTKKELNVIDSAYELRYIKEKIQAMEELRNELNQQIVELKKKVDKLENGKCASAK